MVAEPEPSVFGQVLDEHQRRSAENDPARDHHERHKAPSLRGSDQNAPEEARDQSYRPDGGEEAEAGQPPA
jgi:hypothetical protein